MSMNIDWLPRNHEVLHRQATSTVNYIKDPLNRDRLGFTSGTAAGNYFDQDFEIKYNAFDTAFQEWLDESERTPKKTAKLQEAEEVFKPSYRKLYTGLLKDSPFVTNDDLLSMGLPERHGGGGGHNPPPTTYVSTTVELPGPGRVIIHFRNADSDHKAKPHGVHGAEIRWGLLDVRPTDVSELPNSSFDTRTPFTLDFEGHDRHKTLYFALRWENTTGEKGPWNDIQAAVVP
ncbi:MAG: hypothetical protein LBF90_02305 [Prevotellaceae bacterium]|jgi:hypothetical protein|nr:hypothetical protein [Prevotellaceae bacterium]